MRTALVHYWLVKYRGGERVLELFSDLYPDADLFTLVHKPGSVSAQLEAHEPKTSFIQRMPFGVSHYRAYLPFMPFAVESFDLEPYDLVISSESGPAKGVITRPETCHICYCETPPRYLWNMFHSYRKSLGRVAGMAWLPLSAGLRLWDRAAADRVDFFIANSHNVARRIWKYYRRESKVVHCPVDWERFHCGQDQGYYLYVGELSEYKGIKIAVEAFRQRRERLVVVGDGPLMSTLKKIASPNIELVGWLSAEEVVSYYAGCRGFIFPGEEDFGITPLEAMASGKPVIAYGRGGALETVLDGQTGVFFREATPQSLLDGVQSAESIEWDPDQIRRHARAFSRDQIREQLRRVVDECLHAHEARMAAVGSLPHMGSY